MTLQIQNSESSIKITQNGGSWYIPKPYLVKFIPTVVQPVGGTRGGIITIQYNQGDETKEFDFTWTDCTSPIRASIQLLVNLIESYNYTGYTPKDVHATIVAPNMVNNPYYLESIPVAITPDQPPIPVNATILGPTPEIGGGNVPFVNSISVGLAADQPAVSVKGNIKVSSLTLTRPSDTNAYIAKDTVSNSTSAPVVLTFANIVNAFGESGYITKARLLTNQSANVARFRLHLYRTAPTAINDNSPFTLLVANAATRIGTIDFPACQTEGSGSDAANSMFTIGTLNNASTQSPQGALPFISSSTSIFGILETLDAFTPISAQTFFIELTADVNG